MALALRVTADGEGYGASWVSLKGKLLASRVAAGVRVRVTPQQIEYSDKAYGCG